MLAHFVICMSVVWQTINLSVCFINWIFILYLFVPSRIFKANLRPTQHYTYRTRNGSPCEGCVNVTAVSSVLRWCLIRDLSKVVLPFMHVLFHLARTEAISLEDDRGTPIGFRSCLSLSSYLNRGFSIFPRTDVLYMNIFGVLSSLVRAIWPNQNDIYHILFRQLIRS